jgi:hypothetical protein|mmetsp:Transcript_48104/g.80881  ORF Transcript_48104/g.80881 Transcript_48104/m.80881 type:complete len:94 (+) Transcript_48104:1687-1968(+)
MIGAASQTGAERAAFGSPAMPEQSTHLPKKTNPVEILRNTQKRNQCNYQKPMITQDAKASWVPRLKYMVVLPPPTGKTTFGNPTHASPPMTQH